MIFGLPKPKVPVTEQRRFTMIVSKSGRMAVIVHHGMGHNAGRFIHEINQDGTPSAKKSYWIKGYSENWKWAGVAEGFTVTSPNGDVDFGIKRLRRYHEHTEVFMAPVKWIVFAGPLALTESETKEVEILATSAATAKRLVAQNPECFSLPAHSMVRGCMLKSYYLKEWKENEPEPATSHI